MKPQSSGTLSYFAKAWRKNERNRKTKKANGHAFSFVPAKR